MHLMLKAKPPAASTAAPSTSSAASISSAHLAASAVNSGTRAKTSLPSTKPNAKAPSLSEATASALKMHFNDADAARVLRAFEKVNEYIFITNISYKFMA